jgi:hypothetical protein
MDFNPIIQAVASHRWELLGGLLVGAVVATAKQGWLGAWIQKKLPPRFIPFLAPTYASLLALAGALTAGDSAQQCLSVVGSAVMSAFVAVIGHEMLIEGVRNGKEIVPEKKPASPAAPPPLPKAA